MGELSDALEEFEKISKVHYKKIMEILEEKYCWKCPMRSTSDKSFCREVDVWIRLTNALEDGIIDLLEKNLSRGALNAITMKYLSKISKNSQKYDRKILLKSKRELKPFATRDSLLIIKENPGYLKEGDLVLISEICPIYTYSFSKTKLSGSFPFRISRVVNSFQKEGSKHVKTEEGLELPVEYLTGKVVKIIEREDPLYSQLNL